MCAVKMDINTNTNSCIRKVTIKGLKGVNNIKLYKFIYKKIKINYNLL